MECEEITKLINI